jgi:hypothetical protein
MPTGADETYSLFTADLHDLIILAVHQERGSGLRVTMNQENPPWHELTFAGETKRRARVSALRQAMMETTGDRHQFSGACPFLVYYHAGHKRVSTSEMRSW